MMEQKMSQPVQGKPAAETDVAENNYVKDNRSEFKEENMMNMMKKVGAMAVATAAVSGTFGLGSTDTYAADTGMHEAPAVIEEGTVQNTEELTEHVETAKEQAAQAEQAVADAEDAAALAEADFEAASKEAEEAEETCPVTEEAVQAQEEAVAQVREEADAAMDAVTEAETAESLAAEEVEKKQSEEADARLAKEAADLELEEAEQEEADAQDAYTQAAVALDEAKALRDGAIDLTDTEEYAALEKAYDKLEDARTAEAAEKQNLEQAKAEYDRAADAVQGARKDLEDAQNALKEAQTQCAAVEAEAEQAGQAASQAQAAYDEARAAADAAESALKQAETAFQEADAQFEAARTHKNAADKQVEESERAVLDAVDTADAQYQAEVVAAQVLAAGKEDALGLAKKALAAAEEKYNQGMLGFINWMLEKTGLSKDQKQDLNAAKEVLENAAAENLSKWGSEDALDEKRGNMVLVIGDPYDATNLENIRLSIDTMKTINKLRASDDNYVGGMKRNDAYTNFYFLSVAEAGAMRGAALHRHSALLVSCEDLAFGYGQPTDGWYTKEKKYFDEIKADLGISVIESQKDVDRIEEEASRRGVVVGHYTNLMWSADQVMGVGRTQYAGTSCYNASKASNYTDDRYNRAQHLYTIEEMEALFEAYYKTVDKSSCEEACERAKQELTEAENTLLNLSGSYESRIAEVVSQAAAQLTQKEQEAQEAEKELTAAAAVRSTAQAAMENAAKQKEAAGSRVMTAADDLETAGNVLTGAKQSAADAALLQSSAEQEVKRLAEILKTQLGKEEKALFLMEFREELTAEAGSKRIDAELQLSEAAAAMDALTGDDVLTNLTEALGRAEQAIEEAAALKESRTLAVYDAIRLQADAEEAVKAAQNTLQTKASETAELRAAYEEACARLSQAEAELAGLQEGYAPVTQARAKKLEAEKRVAQAAEALKQSKAGLEQAQLAYLSAQAELAAAIDRRTHASAQENIRKVIDESAPENIRTMLGKSSPESIRTMLDRIDESAPDNAGTLLSAAVLTDIPGAADEMRNAYTGDDEQADAAEKQEVTQDIPAAADRLAKIDDARHKRDGIMQITDDGMLLEALDSDGTLYTAGFVDKDIYKDVLITLGALLSAAGLTAVVMRRKKG